MNDKKTEFAHHAARSAHTFMLIEQDKLERWASKNSADYVPDRAAFGAGDGGIKFTFQPMTTAEFTAETGDSLPGPEMNFPSELDGKGGTALQTVMRVGEFTSPINAIPLGIEANWLKYRRASGTFIGSGMPRHLTFDPPGDAPWSDEDHTSWTDSVDSRTKEVDDVRGELSYLADALTQAAKDYMDTDLETSDAIDASRDYGDLYDAIK